MFQNGNGQRVTSTDRYQVDDNSGNINFRPLDSVDDGAYVCTALNTAGNVSSAGYLTVWGQSKYVTL